MSNKQMEILQQIYIDTIFTDCTIIVDSVKFKCHKVILSTGSEFFKHLFLSDTKDSVLSEFHLNGVPLMFKIYREYIYTRNKGVLFKYDMRNLMNMLKCGQIWSTPSLVNDCADILLGRAKNMEAPDLTVLFDFGYKYNNATLINGITNILKSGNQNSRSFFFRVTNNDRAFLLNYNTFMKLISDYNEKDRLRLVNSYIEFNQALGNDPSGSDEI